MQGTERLYRAAGMDDYLTKPLDRAQLSETIDRHLASAESSCNVVESHTPSALPLADTVAPVDWEQILKVCGDDSQFAQELVQLFIDSGDATLRDINAALSRGDLVAIRTAAHSLKGSSANIHAFSASAAAWRLEEAVRSGNVNHISQMEEQLRCEVGRVMGYLRARR